MHRILLVRSPALLLNFSFIDDFSPLLRHPLRLLVVPLILTCKPGSFSFCVRKVASTPATLRWCPRHRHTDLVAKE